MMNTTSKMNIVHQEKTFLVGNLQSLAEEEQTEGEEPSPPSSGSLESGPLRYESKPSSGEWRDNLQKQYPLLNVHLQYSCSFV